MTTFQLYWLTRLDSLNGFLQLVVALCGLALLCSPFVYMMLDDMTKDSTEHAKAAAKRVVKTGLSVGLSAALAMAFIPSTAELVAIYGISYLTQNKDAREIPAEALKVLNQKLKKLAEKE